MTAKKWLYRAYNLNKEIDQALARKQTEWDRITKITATLSATGGGDSDPHKFEKYAEFRDNIDRLIDKYYDAKMEIMEVINKIQDSRMRQIYMMKFVDGMTFEEIADKVELTDRHVRRLYSENLKELESYVLECPLTSAYNGTINK